MIFPKDPKSEIAKVGKEYLKIGDTVLAGILTGSSLLNILSDGDLKIKLLDICSAVVSYFLLRKVLKEVIVMETYNKLYGGQ